MAGPATILREIHRLRRHAKDLQAEIERGPRLVKGQQAKVARQEEAAREAHETLKRLKVASHEKEVQLKTKQQQIAKHQKQLNEAASKKEYDALQAEIVEDKKACQRLEDEILNGLMEIEERTAQLPEVETTVQRAKEEYAAFEKTSQSRQTNLAEQLNQALQTLKEVETTLPPDIRPQYARLVTARSEDALAGVHERTCMACYTGITAQNYNDLILGQFVVCKSCGRILYLPE